MRDLELEARGRHRRRDHEERAEGLANMSGCYRERINLVPIDTGIGHRNMQTETRFS